MRRVLTTETNVLISGVTGLIGGEILRRLMRTPTGRVWSLIRPSETETVDYRMSRRLIRSGEDGDSPDHISAVAGNILEDDWGLTGLDRYDIVNGVDMIIHNAADTSFAAHTDTTTTNVNGVKRLIEFARTCKKAPLIVYMSTASNVGDVTGRCITEDEGCQPGNHHFNEYTHSKAIAEEMLRASGLPVLTLRPTIVLSEGLPDAKFARQILWCVPLTRAFRALPLNPDTRLDLVDVGFVADATIALLRCPTRNFDCYHLSAGERNAVRLSDLSDCTDRYYERKSPLELIRPDDWTKTLHRKYVSSDLRRKVFRSLKHYFPFFNMDVVYDDSRLRNDLGAKMPIVQSPVEYLDTILPLIPNKAALREAMIP